jgi:hypothetical protein
VSKKNRRERGFKVPGGYFEDFEDKFLHGFSEDRQRGFKVPEGYFESFRFMPETAKTHPPEKPNLRAIRNRSTTRVIWMAAAASILLFFGLNYFYNNTSEPGWTSPDQKEISQWIDNELSEVSPYDIAEVYQDVELDLPLADASELEEYLSEIELEQFLVEN